MRKSLTIIALAPIAALIASAEQTKDRWAASPNYDWFRGLFVPGTSIACCDEADAAVDRLGLKAAVTLIAGTFIVAVCATPKKKAHLLSLDFKTGLVTRSRAKLMTDGTDPAAFKRDAKRNLARYSGQLLPGDLWLSACMDNATSRCPQDVDWPVDILVANPTNHQWAGITSVHLTGPAVCANPSFLM